MLETALKILLLLIAANAAPILAARALRSIADWPVDMGLQLADGRPLLGSSKTWRGLCAALLLTSACSVWLGLGYRFGLLVGALAMLGDLLSSFIKRRRGLAPSDQSLGLDQLPESALPVAYAVLATDLPWWWIIVLPLVFSVLELVVSRPLYWLKIRKRPY